MSTVFDPLRMGAVSLDMLVCGRASQPDLEGRQHARLRALLAAAVRGSGIYRERLKGKVPEMLRLRDLPLVSKRELMGNFSAWVTDPDVKLPDLRAFVADPRRIGEAYLNKYLVWESSGTSHEPCVFVQDARALAVYDALEALRRSSPRPLQRWLDPMLLAERIAFVGATTGHFASMVSTQRLRELSPFMAKSVQCFSILQSTRSLLEELNAFAPTVIATYPTVAAMLADQSECGALRFVPKEVWTGGETLSAAVRKRLETVWACAVRNSYGASEFFSIGWECSHGQMHANADWVILEPVDERGHAVPAGALSHTTLLTNLANHVQPIIRFDVGDQIRMRAAGCDCGSTLPVIEVQGRRDDALVMAGRNGKNVTLLPMALTTVLEDEAGVFDFQLHQRDKHTLVLRLDLTADQGELALVRCRTALERFANTQELAPIQVIGELGNAISRGRSGKARRVVAQGAAGY